MVFFYWFQKDTYSLSIFRSQIQFMQRPCLIWQKNVAYLLERERYPWEFA